MVPQPGYCFTNACMIPWIVLLVMKQLLLLGLISNAARFSHHKNQTELLQVAEHWRNVFTGLKFVWLWMSACAGDLIFANWGFLYHLFLHVWVHVSWHIHAPALLRLSIFWEHFVHAAGTLHLELGTRCCVGFTLGFLVALQKVWPTAVECEVRVSIPSFCSNILIEVERKKCFCTLTLVHIRQFQKAKFRLEHFFHIPQSVCCFEFNLLCS